MVPTTGSGTGSAGGKPSKVEATKIASQYLRTFVADEARNGLTHFTEDAATVLQRRHQAERRELAEPRRRRRIPRARSSRISSPCGPSRFP